MRKDQQRQILLGVLSLALFLLSLMFISAATGSNDNNYTDSWGNVAISILITCFITIPSFIIFIVFALAAILTEIKIYNERKAKKI